MFFLTKVNVNTTLTQFHGFCKVMVAQKACSVIYRFDILCTCTDDPQSKALSDVKCLFFDPFLNDVFTFQYMLLIASKQF